MKIIFILIAFIATSYSSYSQCKQEYPIIYIEAIDLIKNDEELKQYFNISCGEIKVFPEFWYNELEDYAETIASAYNISIKEMSKKIKRIDKSVEKCDEIVINYSKMDKEFYSSVNKETNNYEAIIRFDRIRGGFLIAEITFYNSSFKNERNWNNIVRLQSSYNLLFDFNTYPVKYWTYSVKR